MNVEIKPATAHDAEALVSIQQKAFKRLYDIYHDEGNPFLRGMDEIEKWLSLPEGHVYKILADGDLVGGVMFWERRGSGFPGDYYLARIYVLPEMQGKGIASAAIALCEATVYNANRWSLDFPIDQAANRRCYEKAGYADTGETREQSEGKIVLALYEKHIPPFRNIKSQLNNPAVREIMSVCVFDNSEKGLDQVAEKYHSHAGWQFFGWVENGELLGICGFEVHTDYVEIQHIAVAKNARGKGVGGKMMTALREKYHMPIEAETDDDAMEFYRKTGFETMKIQKYDVRRWACVKPTPRTLYISDMDGTLLNQNAELSEYTVTALNKLIAQGIHFTVATARTAATSILILRRVAINVPIILMNGVLVFDMQSKQYVKKELLERSKAEQIISSMKKTGLTGLMYTLSGDELITYYERAGNDAMQSFICERTRKYNKKFERINDFADADTDIIYFCYMDTHRNILRLQAEIARITGLRIEMYKDIYSNGDLWYLEVFSCVASKYDAVQFLRQQYGFSRVVGFGDNLNDLPLFAACDKSYAVANAKPEVREKATAVIGAHDVDGVAKWLEENAL